MILALYHQVVESIIATVNAWGYAGIFILMALESSVFPVPSEVVMIPAGVLSARGDLSLVLVFIAGLAGSILGAVVCYYLAFRLGRAIVYRLAEKYGSFFLIRQEHIVKTESYFKNHGEVTIFTSRLLPVVRHLISLPAGFGKMSLKKFCLYTALGAGIWNALLLAVGYAYNAKSELIEQNISTLAWGATILAIFIVIMYVAMKQRKR